jgi:hypothetical protein
MKPIRLIVLSILLFTTACVRDLGAIEPFTGSNPFTPEAAAYVCPIADLQPSPNVHKEGGNVTLGIAFINQSEHDTCNLPPHPQLTLLDGDQSLDVASIPAEGEAASLNIAPGESLILVALWQNYCAETPKSDLTMRVTIRDGQTLDVALGPLTIPDCTDSKSPSTLTVNPYSYPP